MTMKRLMVVCAVAMLAACSTGKESGKTDAASGMTDKHERLLRVAEATRAKGDTDGAKAIYRQMIQQSSTSVAAHLGLASILNAQHKANDALEVLTAAEKLQPDNVDVLRELSNTQINLNQPTDALKTIDRALKESSDDPRLHNTRGIALDMKDQREEAQEAYKKGMALAPEKTGYIENNLAMSYIISRKLNEAIAILSKLVDSPQATPTIRQNLALAYGLAGNADKSLEWSLKDLPPEKAEENQKIYEKLALAAVAFTSPDTSVKPVTVIENPMPAKLPELTEKQKEALKNAMKFMQEGKRDLALDTATPTTKASVEPAKEEKSIDEEMPEKDVADEPSTPVKEEKKVAAETPSTAAKVEKAVENAEPAAGAAKKSLTAPAPKVVGADNTAKTTGNVFTKKVPDVPAWNWKK